jgi:competence protein ComGC
MGFMLVILVLLLIPLFLIQQPSRMNRGISRAISDIRTAAVAAETYLIDHQSFPASISNLIEGGYLNRDDRQEQNNIVTVTSNTIEIHYNGPPSGSASTEEIRRISCRRLIRSVDGQVENLPCEDLE